MRSPRERLKKRENKIWLIHLMMWDEWWVSERLHLKKTDSEMHSKRRFNVLYIYIRLRFVHYASILMIAVYVWIRELNYISYFCVPSRAHSKLYIIIAFDMFLTEINSEDDGIFLYLSYMQTINRKGKTHWNVFFLNHITVFRYP